MLLGVSPCINLLKNLPLHISVRGSMDYIAHGTVSDEYTATIENEVFNFREDDGKEKLFMTYQQTIMEERMFAREEGRREGEA